MFEHTRGSYWGGANLSFGIFTALAIFPLTGLLGIDHLYLRNPIGMIMKIIGNILTLGFLYFYDIVQLLSDGDKIRKTGLQVPGVQPLGIGAGIFKGEGINEAPENTPSSWKYIAFIILTMLPFGGEHFLVGDMWGGIFRAICGLNILLWPVAIILRVMHLYQGSFGIKGLFEDGLIRVLPPSRYPVGGKLGPESAQKMSSGDSWIMSKIKWLFSLIPLGPLMSKIVDAVSIVPSVISTTTTAIPQIGTKVTGELEKLTSVEGLMQLAAEQGVATKKIGGGAAAEEPIMSTAAMAFVIFALLFTAASSIIVKMQDSTAGTEPKDVPPQII